MPNENYYSLFEMSPVPMWISDVASLSFLDVNIAATKVYGYTKEEFLGMTTNDIIDENYRPEKPYKSTLKHIKKNGAVIYVAVESNLITFKEKSARLVVAHDITEKIIHEISMTQDVSDHKEEEHWSRLLESVVVNTTDGVLITDATLDPGPSIIYVNDALTKMSGYARAEILGRQPDLFHRNNLSQKSLVLIKNAMKNKVPCNVEMINYTKAGQPYNVSVNISPVTDSLERITHWISIQRDITKNIKYIKEIEAQNKRLKEIGWMQSHLVRNPLTRIMSLVSLLVAGSSAEDTKILLQYLSKSATDLDKVIANISSNTSC